MHLWQHKKRPEVKFVVVPEGEWVHVYTPRLAPGMPYQQRFLWADSGYFPKDNFVQLYEPVKYGKTDAATQRFMDAIRNGDTIEHDGVKVGETL